MPDKKSIDVRAYPTPRFVCILEAVFAETNISVLVNDKHERKLVIVQLVTQIKVGWSWIKCHGNGNRPALQKTLYLFGGIALDLWINR
jgi:hypothetical protein